MNIKVNGNLTDSNGYMATFNDCLFSSAQIVTQKPLDALCISINYLLETLSYSFSSSSISSYPMNMNQNDIALIDNELLD